MHVILNHKVKELRGKERLEAVILEDLVSGEIQEANYDGVFVFIGLMPNNHLVKDKVELDEWGFVKAPHMMASLPGIFAAGDVRSGSTKQAASAAGEGASAAVAIRQYLKTLGE
jgi:thioredoxin reductase (NADPH)